MPILRWNFRQIALALLGLISLVGFRAHAVRACENVFNDEVAEFTIEETQIAPDLKIQYRKVKAVGRDFKQSEVLGNTGDDILLGISPMGHAYIVVGKVRLDGTILDRTVVIDFNRYLDAGFIIRIKKPMNNALDMLQLRNTTGITCAKTACHALDKYADLKLGEKYTTYLSPYELLLGVLRHGVRDADGNQVPFDVYYAGSFKVDSAMRRIQRSSQMLRNQVLVKGGMVTTGFTAISTISAALIYFLTVSNDDEKKGSP